MCQLSNYAIFSSGILSRAPITNLCIIGSLPYRLGNKHQSFGSRSAKLAAAAALMWCFCYLVINVTFLNLVLFKVCTNWRPLIPHPSLFLFFLCVCVLEGAPPRNALGNLNIQLWCSASAKLSTNFFFFLSPPSPSPSLLPSTCFPYAKQNFLLLIAVQFLLLGSLFRAGCMSCWKIRKLKWAVPIP